MFMTVFSDDAWQKSDRYKEMIERLNKLKPSDYKPPSANSKFIGSWSNGKDEFSTLQFNLTSDGIGLMGASIGAAPVLWSQSNHIATLIIPETKTQVSEVQLKYNPETDYLTLVNTNRNRHQTLYRIGGWPDCEDDKNITTISKGKMSFYIFGKEIIEPSSAFIDVWISIASSDVEGIKSVSHPSWLEQERGSFTDNRMAKSAKFANAYDRIEIRSLSSQNNIETLRIAANNTDSNTGRKELEVTVEKFNGEWLIRDIED